MKKYIAIALLISSQSFGQIVSSASAQYIDLDFRQGTVDPFDLGSAEPIEGSLYLDKEFSEAFIITERGDFSTKKMRYNLDEDAMEFEMEGQKLMMDPTPLIKSVTIGPMVFVAADFMFKGKVKRGFLELVEFGDYALYAKKNISYRAPEAPKALGVEGLPARYVRKPDTYFFKIPGEELTKVASLKEIIALLDNDGEVLKKYVKKEKLKNKGLGDMAAMVKYLNSL